VTPELCANSRDTEFSNAFRRNCGFSHWRVRTVHTVIVYEVWPEMVPRGLFKSMPYQQPGTLGTDETYALTAYIL